MRIRLGWKLSLTYLVLIVLALSAFGYFTMDYFQRSFLQDQQSTYFTYASILANRAAPYMDQEAEGSMLNYLVTDFAERFGSRFMLTDKAGRVLADSLGEMEGRTLTRPEIRTALAGANSAQPKRETAYGWVLYLAVPVNHNQQVLGAVFLSADINPLVERLDLIRIRLLVFSVLSGLGVFVVSLLLGRFLTEPLQRLTHAAQKIGAGQYGVQVPDRGSRDEIGELTRVFNEMSTRVDRADQVRKRFVADASHELRTPLAGVRATLDAWADREAQTGETAEFIRDLKSETGRLARLVDDLLVLSRIEGERRQLKIEDVSAGELIEAVRKAVLPIAEAGGHEVLTVHEGNLYWPMDGDMLFRVLLNLADNAVKYSVPGGKVEIGFQRRDGKLTFYVTNEGQGIPETEIPRLFDRFYRVDKARSRKSGGWGLGLAIVKEIVGLHGGRVTLASQPGGITVASVELPRLS